MVTGPHQRIAFVPGTAAHPVSVNVDTLAVDRLLVLPASTLGPAAPPPMHLVAATLAGARRWRVVWAGPGGKTLAAERPIGGGAWAVAPASPETGALPPTPSLDALPEGAPAGARAIVVGTTEAVVVRSGQRIVGQQPRFPSASIVLTRGTAGAWQDVAIADEAPETPVGDVVLAVADQHALAVYVVPGGEGITGTVRAVELSLATPSPKPSVWNCLTPYPLAPGMAGLMAGQHRGVLVAGGGANFPDRPPWEGGVKRMYDAIYVLRPGASAWQAAGHFATTRAYGATVSIPEGVLIAGGENETTVFQDTIILQWDGEAVRQVRGPELPHPVTCAAAAVVDGFVYLAGGYTAGTPRLSQSFFWRLRLGQRNATWEVLPSWSGPTRALAVAASAEGAFFLFSGFGLRLAEGTQTPEAAPGVYLRDAHRFDPASGWSTLPDLPWSALAAPTPAPVLSGPGRILLLGGVDGRQTGHLPRGAALPNDILSFDLAERTWRHWPEPWPVPVVCISAVEMEGGWIIPSGEVSAGRRTTDVVAWRELG